MTLNLKHTMLHGVLPKFVDQFNKNILPLSQDANTIQLNPRLIMTIRALIQIVCICH